MHQYATCLVIELLLCQIHPNILLINVLTLTSELLVPSPDRIRSATLLSANYSFRNNDSLKDYFLGQKMLLNLEQEHK